MSRRATPEARLQVLMDGIVTCRRCPRLVAWREQVACEKRASYRDEDYWGKPVPGFGDPAARVLISGLAPAAHGGNRTGRVSPAYPRPAPGPASTSPTWNQPCLAVLPTARSLAPAIYGRPDPHPSPIHRQSHWQSRRTPVSISSTRSCTVSENGRSAIRFPRRRIPGRSKAEPGISQFRDARTHGIAVLFRRSHHDLRRWRLRVLHAPPPRSKDREHSDAWPVTAPVRTVGPDRVSSSPLHHDVAIRGD